MANAYASYNAQCCEGWKQRIAKEEHMVMGMLEQSRTTPRNPIVPPMRRKSQKRESRPPTASSVSALQADPCEFSC